MSFNYAASTPQAIYSPASKPLQVKSFKIDLAASNATTAVANVLGYLPKNAQIMELKYICTTAVSGPSVTAATIAISCGGNLVSGVNVFAQAIGVSGAATYFANNYGVEPSTDQTITYTLTLTEGTTATAGVIWVNVFYVS